MFLGTHTPKLDDKGRFFIPAKFRDALKEGLVITRHPDRCLAIYPRDAYEAEATRLMAGSTSLARVRNIQRMFASGAADETPDAQGRLSIPPRLREYAQLGREIVVVGALNRVEVWDAQLWEQYSAEQEDAYAEMNEELFDPR